MLILTFQTLPLDLPPSSLTRWMKEARGEERNKIKKNRAINKCNGEGGSEDRKVKPRRRVRVGSSYQLGKKREELNSSVKKTKNNKYAKYATELAAKFET